MPLKATHGAHNWLRPRVLAQQRIDRIVVDFIRLAPAFEARGLFLQGPSSSGQPEIHSGGVAFNGMPGHAGEPFHFPAAIPSFQMEALELVEQGSRTGLEPYDLAVKAFLLIAKFHLGPALQVRNDQRTPAWLPAMELCQQVLRFGDRFRIFENELVWRGQ